MSPPLLSLSLPPSLFLIPLPLSFFVLLLPLCFFLFFSCFSPPSFVSIPALKWTHWSALWSSRPVDSPPPPLQLFLCDHPLLFLLLLLLFFVLLLSPQLSPVALSPLSSHITVTPPCLPLTSFAWSLVCSLILPSLHQQRQRCCIPSPRLNSSMRSPFLVTQHRLEKVWFAHCEHCRIELALQCVNFRHRDNIRKRSATTPLDSFCRTKQNKD